MRQREANLWVWAWSESDVKCQPDVHWSHWNTWYTHSHPSQRSPGTRNLPARWIVLHFTTVSALWEFTGSILLCLLFLIAMDTHMKANIDSMVTWSPDHLNSWQVVTWLLCHVVFFWTPELRLAQRGSHGIPPSGFQIKGRRALRTPMPRQPRETEEAFLPAVSPKLSSRRLSLASPCLYFILSFFRPGRTSSL